MGRNSGPEPERGEHPVTVKPFKMEKHEVTNGEYYQFVSQMGYQSEPSHWVNHRPIVGQEKMPVRDVNIADVNAFIAWRLNRDGVVYRLPTEEEWEYAARNGEKGNLYPWGNTFDSKCAVVDKGKVAPPVAVGTASCPNQWGVMDLIGNVFEWTSSKAQPYPGGVRTTKATETENMIRGGCASNFSAGPDAITSTYRQFLAVSKRDLQLGFRLVTDN